MNRFRPLRNPIRHYSWGSRTALAALRGESAPAPRPEAELWMGAHPLAPSEVLEGERWISLAEWIDRDPDTVLGRDVARRFGGELPFLLKVLAAERPLSLQAHPDPARAAAGFERENRAGLPLDAPNRIYRDPNSKPELLCAFTHFSAVCGFRPIDDIVAQVDELRARRIAALLGPLREVRNRANLRRFYQSVMGLGPADAKATVEEVVESASSGYGDSAVRGWLRKLGEAYPGDPGVLAPVFLNLLELRPGEALFLPPGELHAYLCGTAVEIMANSDNVIRGGLTSKHVDVAELLEVLAFEAGPPTVLTPREVGPGEALYETPAQEFELSVLRPRPGLAVMGGDRNSVEILFCAEGVATLADAADGDPLEMHAGASVIVPGAAARYTLRGDATVYRAVVPAASDIGRS